MATVVEDLAANLTLPPWVAVHQSFPHHGLASVSNELRAQLRGIRELVRPADRVAIAVGSRGIGNVVDIVRCLVETLRSVGATPFIVPAMGSHGGGTAEGQTAALAALGIRVQSVGAEVRSSMDTVRIGRTDDGIDVHVDRIAVNEADVVIPIARIKHHTAFRGQVESGLHKILAVGLGNAVGAESIHSVPYSRFSAAVQTAAGLILEKLSVPFGIAILEDAYGDAGRVEVVPHELFAEREPQLLKQASEWTPRLPFSSADVLVVQEIGKDISGAGMDPSVTGRYSHSDMEAFIDIASVVILDLTTATEGNACGMGLADVITRRAADKIDFLKTYTNHITARLLRGAKMPLVANNDREAVAIAASTIQVRASQEVRLAWIKNTREIADIFVSVPLWKVIRDTDSLSSVGAESIVEFDSYGNLLVPNMNPV